MVFIDKFNEEIKDKEYITLEEREILIKKYNKSVDKLINIHNEEYFKEKRKEVTILDNINGYPLDDYQSKVVLSNEKATLVVAGAGSGKSLTIIGKIVYLVNYCHIDPDDILCISFTNDATINLKNNIAKNYNFKINIYTFHKLALEILKQNNVSFVIAPDNFLEETIDNFFNNIIPNNEKYMNSLKIILGKDYKDKDISSLKRLIITFISLFKSNNYDISYFKEILKKIKLTINYKDYRINKNILLLIINIYLLYEDELHKEDAIDFNDMINKSLDCLKSKGLKKKWKYVIVDEYQDTSMTKFNLIKEIIHLTGARFLAVGDDFQSIYRFTGCTLHLFLNFTKLLPYAKIFQIVNTYRNPQELINVAGKFIMKNKAQQKKNLVSHKHLDYPVKIYFSDNRVKALKSLLMMIKKNKVKEVMVLGRNNKDIKRYIDKEFKVDNDIYTYNDFSFRYLTMHKSKGLESEVVILINIEDSLIGMPTQIKQEKLLKYVNKQKEYYKYEEERRLFYVALTRTKTITYIISPLSKQSIFVKEILKDKKYVEQIKM